MSTPINCIIAGAQGYVGKELQLCLGQHPHFQLAGILQHQQSLQGVPNYSLDELISRSHPGDVVFLCTPADQSMEIASALVPKGYKIIDLSGAFRLPQAVFEQWYAMPHTAAHLLAQANYGLTPWQKQQASTTIIANPGCYATCSLLSLLPLLAADLIVPDSIIIDAKSGVSGAGKKVQAEYLFCELANNYLPYKIGSHQHIPEINQQLQAFTGKTATVRLTTALLPLIRGIAMSIYTVANKSGISDTQLLTAVTQAYAQAYQAYSLVRFQVVQKENTSLLGLQQVIQTPYCHIAYFVQDGTITVFSCLDNLLKGAASQAIENANALFGFPLHTGLQPVKELA